nr:MAG TPA: hypothetical protein [Caudoviricetes sp.]
MHLLYREMKRMESIVLLLCTTDNRIIYARAGNGAKSSLSLEIPAPQLTEPSPEALPTQPRETASDRSPHLIVRTTAAGLIL